MASIAAAVRRIKSQRAGFISEALVAQACEVAGHVQGRDWRDRRITPLVLLQVFALQVLHGNVACRAALRIAAMGVSVHPRPLFIPIPFSSLETIRQPTGRRATCAYHRAVTSLRSEQADADELLDMLRGHWGIEHRLFPIRDVTFGEDACRVRTGQAPRILAMLRNLAVSLLHQARCPNHAAALRRHAAHPQEALRLLQEYG